MSFSFTNRELYFHIYGHTLTFISVKKYFKSFQSFKLTVKLKNLVTIEKWELEIYIYHKCHISLPIILPFISSSLTKHCLWTSIETLWKKKEFTIFYRLESFVDMQLLISTHYSICYTICLSILYLNPLTLTKCQCHK